MSKTNEKWAEVWQMLILVSDKNKKTYAGFM